MRHLGPFAADAVGHALQQVKGQPRRMRQLCRIARLHGAQSDDHASILAGQRAQQGEILPQALVQPRSSNFLGKDQISRAQRLQPRRSNIAQNAQRQPAAGEGLPPQDRPRGAPRP